MKFRALTKREKLQEARALTAATAPLLPVGAYIFHAFRICAYWVLFWLICAPENAANAFAKFTLWGALWNMAGIAVSAGPLADGHHGSNGTMGKVLSFAYFQHRLTLGTLKVPPVEFACLPRTRGWFDFLLILASVSVAIWFLLSETEWWKLQLAVLLFTILAIMDKSVYLSVLGYHWGYHLFCLAWSENCSVWLPACQLVQAANIMWSGFAKIGPWFTNGAVISQMIGNSPTTPVFVRRLMFRDLCHGDCRPSAVAKSVSRVGLIMEILMPLLAICAGNASEANEVRLFGIIGCVCIHAFVIFHFPLGGIQEWNVYSAACFVWLNRWIPMESSHNQYPGGLSLEDFARVPALLMLFVLGVCYAVPFIALWRPHWFGYGLAMQQYTGNWPAGQVLLRKSAVTKVASAFPTIPNLVDLGADNNDAPQKGDEANNRIDTEYLAYVFEALNLQRHVTLRAIPRLAEIATGGRLEEYALLDMRQLLGLYDDDQTIFTDGLLIQLAEKCKLFDGDLLVISVSSFPSFTLRSPRMARWRIRDAVVDSKAKSLAVAEGAVTIDALTDQMDADVSCLNYDDMQKPLLALETRGTPLESSIGD